MTPVAPETLEELNYERDVRDSGAKLARDHSESWAERCWRTILMLADRRIPFTADDVRARIGSPPVANAMGALFLRASKIGVIQAQGMRQSPRRGRHAGSLKLWVGV